MKRSGQPELLLLDGSSYLYRAFYAMKRLTNRSGLPTHAVYGFTQMLIKVLKQFQPQYLAIVFDTPGRTFRKDMLESYKSSRPSMPEELVVQIPYVKAMIDAFRIVSMEQTGFEADDILGSLAVEAQKRSWKTTILTGDKDLLQLVNDQTQVYDTGKNIRYDAREVENKFGVSPEHLVDFLGLTGDSVDDIPGVPGIGEKTAVRLMKDYKSIEGIYDRIDTVMPESLRKKLVQHQELARLSLRLATIRCDVPVSWDTVAVPYAGLDHARVQKLFKELDFNIPIQPGEEKSERQPPLDVACRIIRPQDLAGIMAGLQKHDSIAIVPLMSSPEPMRAELIGLTLASDASETYYLPVGHATIGSPPQISLEELRDKFGDLLNNDRRLKIGYDIKNLYILMERLGAPLSGPVADVLIAAHLLEPEQNQLDIETLVGRYGDRSISSAGPETPSNSTPVEEASRMCGQRAAALLELNRTLQAKISAEKMDSLYNDIEIPLIRVIAGLESCGVKIDTAYLRNLSKHFGDKLATIRQEVYALAGMEFNIDSPKQLQEVLYQRLQLKPGRKTKTGFSTDVTELERLAAGHPLPDRLLSYRTYIKLKNTYIDALPELVHQATGRIHTSYHQAGTATGRLSSRNPNLQNIPIRTPEGRMIRQAFVPEIGYSLLSADYSQIELRVLAHLSDDPVLIAAFREGRDIHRETAAEVFGVPPGEVTDDMRQKSKVINFGIVYGMSAYGLSQQLGVDRKEADEYIQRTYRRYPQLKPYLDLLVRQAEETGFVSTLFGRKRWIPDIKSANPTIKGMAMRMAINTPVQGTAADLMKMAMIQVHRALESNHAGARIIMQVHDELVIEVKDGDLDSVSKKVRDVMEQVYTLKVPLTVNMARGKNWADME